MASTEKSVKLTAKDVEVLRSAANGKRDTFQPWRGVFGRARRLARDGYLKDAGFSAMPPYVLYVITPAGRAVFAQSEGE